MLETGWLAGGLLETGCAPQARKFLRVRADFFSGVRAERREEQVPKLSKFKLDGDEIVASVDGAALA